MAFEMFHNPIGAFRRKAVYNDEENLFILQCRDVHQYAGQQDAGRGQRP